MDYFLQLTLECDNLTEKGQAYLDRFEFLSINEMADRVLSAARKLWDGMYLDESWEKLPEWVQSCYDGYVPFSLPSKNGSLFYALGYSPTAQEAHLRNLLEIVEGRETEQLDFPFVVPKDFYKQFS